MPTVHSERQLVTTLPDYGKEARTRMIKYSVAMGIRMICIFAMLVVDGWLLVICATGAIVLPYFAMIIANTVMLPKEDREVMKPSEIVRVG